ncbi:uncharacterized protein [Typha latifolia]|uniref:uncharacterized protein n=1 Tax=Typha latifolia TaxID=4733 RepID=UPI003C2D01C0
MNRVATRLSSLLRRSEPWIPAAAAVRPPAPPQKMRWERWIRVRVRNGNLEQALGIMERKITSSGMERLIRRQVEHHVKNSEKRVLARKNLQLRIRSQELARKLRTILVKKIRGH